MAGLGRRRNTWLSALIPEKRLLIQSGSSTSYIRITPLAQLGLGASALAMAGWMIYASSVTIIDHVAGPDRTAQLQVLQGAYDAQVQALSAERDRGFAEAEAAQTRFRAAMEQIGRQQTALLEVVQERRELASSVEATRNRLSQTADSDPAPQMDVAAGTPDAGHGSSDDLARTLDTISATLADAVVERDTASADRDVLALAVADLELRMQMAARNQDDVLNQLEQAVALSFGPLEEMFGKSEVDVEELLVAVRGGFTGTGGPAGEATVSTRSFDDAGVGSRLNDVMLGLDRMNLMRIAAGRMPYAMPVTASFRFTSGYGSRRDPKGAGRRHHNGIDLAGPRGTPIHATADGVGVSAKYENGYGNTVRIRHDFGFETVYAHQSKLRVTAGQQVSRGERIGDMGSTGRSTGVHLHYEVHLNGRPVNPMTYLEAARNVF